MNRLDLSGDSVAELEGDELHWVTLADDAQARGDVVAAAMHRQMANDCAAEITRRIAAEAPAQAQEG